jgi:hypothetical protein
MASALKTWRQSRRQADFWQRAKTRSETLPKAEVLYNIDLAIMTAGQAISRYRTSSDQQVRQDQLLEVQMHLEAALGMLDHLLGGPS